MKLIYLTRPLIIMIPIGFLPHPFICAKKVKKGYRNSTEIRFLSPFLFESYRKRGWVRYKLTKL